jgi:hypothetical protein
MFWQVYQKDGAVYIPTVAQTAAGFYVDVDPVAVVAATDIEALQRVIKETIARGNPKIPTPSRATLLNSVILKYANASSWSEFESGGVCWKVVETGGSFRIKVRAQGIATDSEALRKLECLADGIGIDEVARTLAALIHSASLPAVEDPAVPSSSIEQSDQPAYFELTEDAVVEEP